MTHSSEVTVVQQSRAVNNSSGNSEVSKPQLKYHRVEQELFDPAENAFLLLH